MAPRSKKIDKPKDKYTPPNEKPQKRNAVKIVAPSESRAGPSVKKGRPPVAKKLKLDTVKKITSRHGRGAGALLGFGMSETGQLGLGSDVIEVKRPRAIDVSEDVMDVAAGGMHTVVLTTKGEVYTFGCNDDGALGRLTSEEDEDLTPGKVEGLTNVVQVSAGDSHSAALLDDGRVYVWGTFRDSKGKIGLIKEERDERHPIQIFKDIHITKVCSGFDHIVALSSDGNLHTFGNGENGQLGRVSEYFTERGGRRGMNLFLRPDLVRIKQRGKGQILFEDCWTLGYGTFAKVKDSDEIYGFGTNNYSQLGIEKKEGTDEGIVILMPKQIACLGGRKWKNIKGGPHHVVALEQSGQVFTMGRNDTSQCGVGKASDHEALAVVPGLSKQNCVEVSTGGMVTYALDTSGKVWTWGQCGTMQLGSADDDEDVSTPIVLKGKNVDDKEVLAVSGGGQHTLLIVKRS